MKSAVAIALFLGCSAVTCRYAVQSNLFHFEPSTSPEFGQIQAILERLHFTFPHAWLAPQSAPPVARDLEKPPVIIPSLPKEETLELIAAAAAKHKVPAAFVLSIVAAESNFNCAAISPRGAIGLMQLMPETAQEFGADPMVPAQNIDAGTRYLRWLMNRYQKGRSSQQRVIAAYNAGPGMVDRYHGIPPFRETRSYVTRVLGFLRQFEGARKRAAFRG